MSLAPDLYAFGDYRSFLLRWHEYKRSARPGWSYRTWARQLGLRSPSTLVMILQGKRNPSEKLTGSLSRCLRLKAHQAEYFHDLVLLEKSRNDIRSRMLILERLQKNNRLGSFSPVDPQKFAAISRWYYYAIREMTQLRTFQEDPHWIASHLNFEISPKQAREALRALLKMGLLVRAADGRIHLGKGTVEVSSEVACAGIREFHEQALANAAACLQALPPEEREMRGTTFPMPKSRLPRAKELIRKFQNELCDLVEEAPSDAIFHLEIALYPVAEMRQVGHA